MTESGEVGVNKERWTSWSEEITPVPETDLKKGFSDHEWQLVHNYKEWKNKIRTESRGVWDISKRAHQKQRVDRSSGNSS